MFQKLKGALALLAPNTDVLLASACIAAGFAGLSAILKNHTAQLGALDELYQARADQAHRVSERMDRMWRDYQLIEAKLAKSNGAKSNYPAPEDVRPLDLDLDQAEPEQASTPQ